MFFNKNKNNVILRYEYIVQCIKMLIKKTKIYDFQKQYIYVSFASKNKPIAIYRNSWILVSEEKKHINLFSHSCNLFLAPTFNKKNNQNCKWILKL